jgi:DNA-binding beta-propeller fold protein YncE
MQSRWSTRRWFLRAAVTAAGGALLDSARRKAFAQSKQGGPDMHEPSSYLAYVGSRTTRERNARGDGINVYREDGATGRWTHLQLVSGLANPAYLAFDRTKQFLYAVHGDLSDISAFSIDPAAGNLTLINSAGTFGNNPVHLAVDPTNRFIVVANTSLRASCCWHARRHCSQRQPGLYRIRKCLGCGRATPEDRPVSCESAHAGPIACRNVSSATLRPHNTTATVRPL